MTLYNTSSFSFDSSYCLGYTSFNDLNHIQQQNM